MASATMLAPAGVLEYAEAVPSRVPFSGVRLANAPLDDRITREYPAGDLVIEWRQGLCAHSGNCVRSLPRVFNPRRQPWVQAEEANADDVREAVAKCPSGALRVRASS